MKFEFFNHDEVELKTIGFPISNLDHYIRDDHVNSITLLIILQLLQTSPELQDLLSLLSGIIPKFPQLRFIIRKHPRDQSSANSILTEIIEFENVSYDKNPNLIDSIKANTILMGMNSSALLDGLFLGRRVIEWLPYDSSYSYLSDYCKVTTFTKPDELIRILSDITTHGHLKINSIGNPISYQEYFRRIIKEIEERN
jgi:hypothetical protein